MSEQQWHVIKCRPDSFDELIDGRRRYEVRNGDDRKYAEGDVLVLREWLTDRDAFDFRPGKYLRDTPGYSGRVAIFQVNSITRENEGKRLFLGKHVVMGLMPWNDNQAPLWADKPIVAMGPVTFVPADSHGSTRDWIYRARTFLRYLDFIAVKVLDKEQDRVELSKLLTEYPEGPS